MNKKTALTMKNHCFFFFLLFAGNLLAQPRKDYVYPDTVWSFNAHGLVAQYPYADDSMVVIGNDYGLVYALDAATGKQLWKFTGPEKMGHGKKAIIHCIAGDGKQVYFNNCSASVMCLDKKTGKLVWEYDHSRFDDDILTRILQTDSSIIMNTLAPSILALRKRDGKVLWEFTEFGFNSGPSAIVQDKNSICFTGYDSTLTCIDLVSGKKRWSVKTGTGATLFGPAVVDDKIAVSHFLARFDSTGSIECYGMGDHQLKWKKMPGPGPVFACGTTFLFLGNGMHCLDAASGKELWKIDGDFTWYTAPAFDNGKIIYQDRQSNLLMLIDAGSGKILQQYAVEGKSYSVPVVRDKYIYYSASSTFWCMRRP
jgi:outer membrane protein assembly factor BamB